MSIYRNGEIYLYGDVGDLWFDESFVASEVVEALALHGPDKDVTVHINSGGGIATEGAAIHAILSSHGGKVAIEVDGIAASAASIIAMAGDTITMRLGSVMMIHDPAGYFMGYTEDDIDEAKAQLSALASTMAAVYAAKSGKSAEHCRSDMRSTLWLTPEEAVQQGYATSAGNSNSVTVAAFDYRIYANAPTQLVAQAKQENWKLRAAVRRTENPEETGSKTMAKNDIVARIQMIMTSDAATGRKELAEHLAYETEIDADSAIAAMEKAPLPSKPSNQSFENGHGSEYSRMRVSAAGQAMPNGSTSSSRSIFSQVLETTNKGRK